MQKDQINKEKITFHYAPMTGNIMKYVNGKAQETKDWSKYHEVKDEFFKLQRENKLLLEQTLDYGHELFHGHNGRVDIYSVTGDT